MQAENKRSILEGKDKAIAEGLDNKAPIKSIIESIDAVKTKEKSLSSYIQYVVRRRIRPSVFFSASDFLFPAQPRNLFTKDWDGALETGFLESFSHKSLLPWMMTTAHSDGQTDPVTDILRKRHNWKTKWTTFKRKSKKMSYKWFDDDVIYCHKAFTEMAAHLEKNPDPFFEGVYNWYYAGKGNMHVAQLGGLDYLVYSTLNCLYVSPFFRDNLSIDYANTATYQCQDDLKIMETVINSQNIIALRTKHKVIILKIVTSEEPMRLDRLKEMDSELPFTGITFDEFHKNILYVTTLDFQLTIVNLDRMAGRTKKLRGKFPTLVDNWSFVTGAERGYYIHVTRNAVTLYDKRTNEPFQRYKSFSFVSDIQTCGKISAVKYCEQQPLLYVGTDHHLFLMDMRCGKTKDTNITPIQRWTHGMMITPTYIDICKYDNDYNREMICLSSQWVEDMCVVSNYSDSLTRTGEIPSLALPYRPPSILQTLNEAQRKRLCSSIYEPIHHRLCTSISGMSIIDRGDMRSILLQNSLGDVSCHNLYPKDMYDFIEDDGVEKLHEWSKDCKPVKELFEVSHVIDISPFLKQLKRVPDNYILGRNMVMGQRVKFNENEIYETFAKEELDPEFLEIWKDHDDEITLDETAGSQFFVDTEL